MPDVVGGTRRLGCWQRHPPRRAKHVKMVILENVFFFENGKRRIENQQNQMKNNKI